MNKRLLAVFFVWLLCGAVFASACQKQFNRGIADRAMSRLLNSKFGQKALENWGEESIEGLAKASDKGFLQAAERISTKYGDDIAEIMSKGINRGVIEADDELMYRLADYTKAMRKAGFGADPLELANEHRVIRLMKTNNVSTKVGGETINNVAVFTRGVPDSYGYNHIFTFIRPGQTTTRARQIQEAFGLVNDNTAVMDLVSEALKKGTPDISNPKIIEYAKNGKIIKVVTGSDADKIGKIITVSFG